MRAHLEHAPPSPAWEAAPPLRDRLQIGFGPFARTLSRVLSAAVSGRAPSQSPDSKTFLDLDASYFLDKRIYKADITLNVQPKVVTFMFGLSNTSGYGILALSCLVMHPDQWVLAQQITETTSVPKPYLLKILNLLAEAKLIEAKRGYRGGFRLARPATEISLWEIAEAIEGPHLLARCLLGLADCRDDRACPTHDFWREERRRIEKQLHVINLAQIADFEWKWHYRREKATP